MNPTDHRLLYLSSPYTRYVTLHAAARDASMVGGKLAKLGYSVLSPIAHGHMLAVHGGIDPLDHKFWMKFSGPLMDVCDAMIIAMLDGWKASEGVSEERRIFRAAGKPIYCVNPHTMKICALPTEEAR